VKSTVSPLRLLFFLLMVLLLTYIVWLTTLVVPALREAEAFQILETEFYYSEHVSMYSQAMYMQHSHGSLTDQFEFHTRPPVQAFFAAPLRLINPNGFQRRRALSLYASSTTNAYCP